MPHCAKKNFFFFTRLLRIAIHIAIQSLLYQLLKSDSFPINQSVYCVSRSILRELFFLFFILFANQSIQPTTTATTLYHGFIMWASFSPIFYIFSRANSVFAIFVMLIVKMLFRCQQHRLLVCTSFYKSVSMLMLPCSYLHCTVIKNM